MQTVSKNIRLPWLVAATAVFAVALCARAQDEKKYEPAQTVVAVLPSVDRTGEKATEWRDRQAGAAYRNTIEQFAERGFKIADRDAVKKAIADSKISLDDEEDYRRENFYKVGKAVNADLVAFTVVTSSTEDKKNNLFSGAEIQGRATVKTWLLDVKAENKILSADVKEGKAGGNSKLFGKNEGRGRRVNAVGNAIKEQFGGFLKPYPKVKDVKVGDDGSMSR